jgi:hypothetical protein
MTYLPPNVPRVEYALMVRWPEVDEFVPAVNVAHAGRMGRILYAGVPAFVVAREVPAWEFIDADELPSGMVAL